MNDTDQASALYASLSRLHKTVAIVLALLLLSGWLFQRSLSCAPAAATKSSYAAPNVAWPVATTAPAVSITRPDPDQSSQSMRDLAPIKM